MDQIILLQILNNRFNERELGDLCLRLKIDYEGLEGEGKGNKARQLIFYCERHGLIHELEEAILHLRPDVVDQDSTPVRLFGNENLAKELMGSVWHELEPKSTIASQPESHNPTVTDQMSSSPDLDLHHETMLMRIIDGQVIPFLGGDVNLCGRPPKKPWQFGSKYLPSADELSIYLAEKFKYPGNDKTELVRVSEYAAIMIGLPELQTVLSKLFKENYPPTPLHNFFASLPGVLRAKGCFPRNQLIVTTNSDNGLEHAFQKIKEPFELLSYITEGKNHGKFMHYTPDGKEHLIRSGNNYAGLWHDQQHTVILKVHNVGLNSFFITEDHFIDFLSHTDIEESVPVTLREKLMNGHLLFLGYGLRGWNFRAVLHHIWGPQNNTGKRWWAVQFNPDLLDQKFGSKLNLEIIKTNLENYIAELSVRVLNY